MIPGRFITLEGGEGAGKSTQARLLADALRADGLDVLLTREPGGTTGAEAIRQLLLSNDGDGWHAEAEALLFAAARSDHVARAIRPALAAGTWVVCDRFIDSNRAYQGGAGGLADGDIQALHGFGTGGLLPDLTLLIAVSPETATARLAQRDGDKADRIGARGAAYHAGVAASFARLADQEPGRIVTVDGEGSAQDIHQRVLQVLRAHLAFRA
ncbi:dTMP kinase [Altererythrobacter xixiisoli]|uniref:Thymidylate kinase n=1 Tax=Croceibacterium xixiisoli TaxID=1476466 RepID=A0A6I4TVN6_9SPHN|nr:dTMP kinase [Croceibacterium xixiisoli]MXP00035.1 dTMP kinase [Croceibacterium xixiisoli]